MKTPVSSSPAQLWIGQHATVEKEVIVYLQQLLCSYKGCTTCSTCQLIEQQQHPSCLWFKPQGNYTLEIIKPFFSIISRSLHEDQNFFFIFQHADFLSISCTNSLLKSIEEPPPGYRMLFLTENLPAVAPTLRSRCSIIFKQTQESELIPDLAHYFTKLKPSDPETFLSFLEKATIDERTSMQALTYLVNFWTQLYTSSLTNNTASLEDIEQKVAILNNAFQKLPMPGSGQNFWKNLFLQMQL